MLLQLDVYQITVLIGGLESLDDTVLEEQKRIERQLEQERRDEELAKVLQLQLDKEARYRYHFVLCM
jgi:hypothetical protein